MEPLATNFSSTQRVALAVVPKFTSALSCIGSGWIILEVLRDTRKRGLVYHRLMLAMSVGDVILSCALFLTTWPMPKQTRGVYGAAGTTGTCTAQGFFVQVGWSSQLYQAYLAIYYLLTVRYSWKEGRLWKLERFALGFTILFALCTSIAGIPLELYNKSDLWCWIAALPHGCQENGNRYKRKYGKSAKPCLRGAHAWIYRLLFCFVILWLALLTVGVTMCLVYWTVRQQAERIKRYGGGGWIEKNKTRVGRQAIIYTATFFLLMACRSISMLIQAFFGHTYFPLLLMVAIFGPLQGVFNGLIYLRPRYVSYKEEHPEWTTSFRIRKVLARAFAENATSDDDEDHELGMISTRKLESDDDFCPNPSPKPSKV